MNYLISTETGESAPHRQLSTTHDKDPYSLTNGGLVKRDEIQSINKQMMTSQAESYCKNGGTPKLVYKDISLNNAKLSQYDQKYI